MLGKGSKTDRALELTKLLVFKFISNILKQLECLFNVIIINNDEKKFFTASFDNTPLDYILKTFHKNYGIKYTIQNTNITINH